MFISVEEALCDYSLFELVKKLLVENGAEIKNIISPCYYCKTTENAGEKSIDIHLYVRDKSVIMRVTFPFSVKESSYNDVVLRCNEYNVNEAGRDWCLSEMLFVDEDSRVCMLTDRIFNDYSLLNADKVIWEEGYKKLKEKAFDAFDNLRHLATGD